MTQIIDLNNSWHCFSLMSETLKVAEEIASKSPVAVQTTKSTLVYARDHTVQEGLDQIVSF